MKDTEQLQTQAKTPLSIADVWEDVKAKLEQAYTVVLVDSWFRGVRALVLDGNTVKMEIPSDFQKSVISQQYADKIAAYFESLLGFPIALELFSVEERAEKKKIANRMVEDIDDVELAPTENDYTFSNFIVGSSNKFAHAACQSITNSTGDSFNPLFIYGGSGLGKTHLLYAIRNELRRKHPGYKLLYIKGDDFINDMVESLSRGQSAMRSFREKYRFLDVLLIDDIQFIGGKESTQEEFFHTFNTLYERNKQIVLTSDRPPKEIKTLEERLRTRFEWGLIADVQPPDLETRVAILSRKAADLGIALAPEVAGFIAQRLKKNIRQLEGAIKKLKALHILDHQEPTLEAAETAIRDVLSDNMDLPQLIDRILSEVGFFYAVTVEDIKGNKRTTDTIVARQVAMYLIRESTSLSLKQIGFYFGGKDHSTVKHSIDKIVEGLKVSSDLRDDINEMLSGIKNN